MTDADNLEGGQTPARRPRGRPYKNVASARSVSILGLGMVIGAVLGAGVALLAAPGTGADTRRRLSRSAGRLKRGGGVWTKLGRELERAASAKRKSMEMEAKRKEIEAQRAARGEPISS